MQPYRSVRPHTADECRQCAPESQGHPLCQNDGCDNIGVTTIQRHATAAEYAALPETLMPIDGVALRRVDACDDCAEDAPAICGHAAPEPVPCPKCGAAGDTPCAGKDGKPRARGNHVARDAAQPAPETCQHHHRADCPIFTGCQCTMNDPAPDRPKRPTGVGPGPDISGLTMPAPYAQMILHQAGHPWTGIERAWNLLTQDNRPAVAAEYYRTDDAGNRVYANGQPILDTIVVPLADGPGSA